MDGSFTSGSFGELVVGFSHFHDYKELPYEGSGNSKLYTVISGERKLILKAANKEKGSLTENIARLQREYKLLERLYGNEHIVRCIGWRDDAEVGPCIVMEYIDGETLTDYLKGAPSSKEKKRVLNELLDAVGFIHKQQIVHNDLKPDNILITRNGHNVKLIDFGYADSDSNIDKATGGTKAFAAPELANREGADVTSDIYSLGFIIKALFPHRYGRVVGKCQRKEATRRYENVNEVRNALRLRDVLARWALFLMIAVPLLAWFFISKPFKEEAPTPRTVEEEPITLPERVTDTVFIVKEKHDMVISEQPTQPKKPEQSDVQKEQVVPAVVNSQASSLNFDSIHQVYKASYLKYKKNIEDGIADGSLKYYEFAKFNRWDCCDELGDAHDEMMPEDEDLQRIFENDYMIEYGRYYQSLDRLCATLPSLYDIKDNDSLKNALMDEFYAKLDEFTEKQARKRQAVSFKP